jgi:propionyl-CoA carboxylase alpha chain
MASAALKLAKKLKYESAGTVEFLVDDKTGEFWFLEVNTRLQVEHPVTEATTGIDLVHEQLRIARGEALGYDQEDISWYGSAIEARLYAEDPTNDFLPTTGSLVAFEPDLSVDARWDSGVVQGSVIGTDFDPMIAKVITYGESRVDAANKLSRALESLHIGGVVTNRDFLVAILRSEAFLKGLTTTNFIEKVKPALSIVLSASKLQQVASIAALWIQGKNRDDAEILGQLPSGWRNSRLPRQKISFQHGENEILVTYRSRRDGKFDLNENSVAKVFNWDTRSISVEIDGHRLTSKITKDNDLVVVQMPWGNVSLRELPRFALPGSEEISGGLTAPMPGKVVELKVKVGDSISKGDALVILEAMKMEHEVKAPADGKVSEIYIKKGEQLENGALLMIVDSK